MKKYDLSMIMKKAWKIFRKVQVTFAEALHRSWLSAKAEEINQKRIERARSAAGVTEEVNTWSGWKALGYEVVHGCKALFGAELIWGSRGDNAVYKASFFGRSQVQPIEGGSGMTVLEVALIFLGRIMTAELHKIVTR